MVSKARKIAAQASSNITGRRNLLLNGDMRICQRTTGTSGKGAAAGYFAQDRWRIGTGGTNEGRFTFGRDTQSPDNFAFSMKVDCTTAEAVVGADEYLLIQQRLEGLNCQELKMGTSDAEAVTVSFWVRSPKTGVHTVSLYKKDDADGNNRLISSTYTVASANTWEYHSCTFPGDTTGAIPNDNSEGFALWFWLLAGSDRTSGTFATSWEAFTTANACNSSQVNVLDSTDNIFYLTGCQLERGNSPTSFEFEEYADSLERCKRYYFSYAGTKYGQRYSTSQGFINLEFPREMRASPSILSYSAVRTTTGIGYYPNARHHQTLMTATNPYISTPVFEAEL
tara:strand:+ start:538 stop:1554 length:1017 start_codon:yes stop_codon:yes gene_type:complete